MKTTKSFLLIALLFLSVACSYDKKTNDDVADDPAKDTYGSTADSGNEDEKFVKEAAESSQREVELSILALQKSQSTEIKDFAQEMVNDHSKASNELDSMAISKNIAVPDSLTNETQKKVDELSSKTGEEFDKAYCDMMVKGHKEAVDNFKDEIDNGDDSELQQWARSKLPVLENHLTVAQALEENVKNGRKRSY